MSGPYDPSKPLTDSQSLKLTIQHLRERVVVLEKAVDNILATLELLTHQEMSAKKEGGK